MKKTISIFLISVLVTSAMFTGCKKAEEEPQKSEADVSNANNPQKESANEADSSDNKDRDAAKPKDQGNKAPLPAAPSKAIPQAIDEDDGTPRCEERFCQCGSETCAKNETCRDGKCFCGKQSPLDENYSCKEVFTHPIGTDAQTSSYRYVCQSAEGCACGENTCVQNAACVDGECICGSRKLLPEETGYECYLITDNQYDYVCKKSEGCKCGSITAAVNMGCNGKNAVCNGSPVPGRGLACRPKPYKQYKYQLACFKDECDCYGETLSKDEICEPLSCKAGFEPGPKGCMCGHEKGSDQFACIPGKGGKKVNYCIASECDCGEDKRCPTHSVCLKGECVDRNSLKALPDETAGYKLQKGFLHCESGEGCDCGKKKCENGKYCINGSCFKDPYSRKIDGKVYYYQLQTENLADSDADDGLESRRHELWNLLFVDDVQPICQPPFTEIYAESNGRKVEICYDNEFKEMSVGDFLKKCGVGPVPADVASRYCKIAFERGALSHGPNPDGSGMVIHAFGW